MSTLCNIMDMFDDREQFSHPFFGNLTLSVESSVIPCPCHKLPSQKVVEEHGQNKRGQLGQQSE